MPLSFDIQAAINSPKSYFGTLHETFLRTPEKGEFCRFAFSVAGVKVLVESPCREWLSQLTLALRHLAAEDNDSCGKPHIRIGTWESRSNSIRPRSFEFNEQSVGSHGKVLALSNEEILTVYQVDSAVLTAADKSSGSAFYWSESLEELPHYEIANPFRVSLSYLLNSCFNLLPIHSAAVGFEDKGLLITGKTGSGKSTTSASCLLAGLDFISDDYCFVRNEDKPTVFGLYSSMKLCWDSLSFFPSLGEHLWNKSRPGDNKAVLMINSFAPSRIRCSLPLSAIVVPLLTRQAKTTFRHASGGAILRALAPSTVFQLADGNAGTLNAVRKLVERVPGFYAELSSNPEEVGEAFLNFARSC